MPHFSQFQRCFYAPLAATSLCLASPYLAWAGEPALNVLATWGGPVHDVEVVGNTAYVAAGRRLVVLNIANLAAMTEIGSLDMGSTVHDIAIQNDLAYVATVSGGASPSLFSTFNVVDIADAANMAILWQSPGNGSGSDDPSHEIRLRGSFAYVRHASNSGGAGGDGQIDVYDISQPANPIRLGHITLASSLSNQATHMEIVGDLLYAMTEPRGTDHATLSIYDLTASNPLQPTLLGPPLEISSNPCEAFAIDGDYAFLSIEHFSGASDPPETPDAHIAIVDISNPAAPTIISESLQYTSPGGNTVPRDIGAINGYLYVTEDTFYTQGGRRALRVYDVAANPTFPPELPTFQTHGDIRDIIFSGGLGWVLDDGEGAIPLNISNPAALVRVGNYFSPAILNGMDKVGNLLYVVDAWNGFTILDVSNPTTTPNVVGIFQTPTTDPITRDRSGNYAIDVVGNRAYFTAGVNGFMVVDVANPLAPSLLFTDDPGGPWGAQCVIVKDNVAHVTYTFFATTAQWGYRTYDATTFAILAAPLIPGGTSAPKSIALNNNGILFTGARVPQILDSSDPANPILISSDAGPLESNGVALDGDGVRLLVCNQGNSFDGLYVHNVQNPGSLSLHAFASASQAHSIAVQNHRAYVVNSSRLTVYDISNSSQPQPIIIAPNLGDQNNQIVLDEPYVYITDGITGNDSSSAGGLVIVEGENLQLPPVSTGEGHLYFRQISANVIKRSELDGTGVETLVNAPTPGGIALDLPDQKMYFRLDPDPTNSASVSDFKIQRSNLDGSDIEDVITGLESSDAISIALDRAGGKIYWLRSIAPGSTLRRANLDGSGVETLHTLNAISGFDLDLKGGKIYWTLAPNLSCGAGQGKIQRSNLDGSDVEDVVINLTSPGAIAIDAASSMMYWADRDTGCTTNVIKRADLDGLGVQTLVPSTNSVSGLAIDHSGGKAYLGGSPPRRMNLDGTALESLPIPGGNCSHVEVEPAPPTPCPGDTNHDGSVNVNDLLVLIGSWGLCTSPPCPADLNGNGVIDVNDLLLLIGGWGECG